MTNPEPRGEIDKEAEAHLDLGRLLKLERDPGVREQVAAVLAAEMSLAEKVREIRTIDALATAPAAPTDPEADPETVAQPLSRSLSTVKSVIKLPHSQLSYFEYLFRSRGKIRTFSRRSHVLNLGALLPRLRLDPDVQKPFREELVPLANRLLERCNLAMELGWQHLEKLDYNLITVFKRLCFEVAAVNFRVLNYRDRSLVDSLRNLETYFLVMHYRPEYPGQVARAIATSLASDPDPKARTDHEHVAMEVARLLSPDLMLPSLHDFILGINIVKLRRIFILDDLVCRDLGQIINSRDFACPPATQEHINERVLSLKSQLRSLHKQKSEVEHLKRVLSVGEDGSPDFSPLASLYDNAVASHTFRPDQDNLMLFLPRFLKAFDDAFFPLLCAQVTLKEVGRIAVFDRSIFPMEFHKLRQVMAELTRLNFSLHVFTRARFVGLRSTVKGAVTAESKVLQQIDEAVRLILEMATKVEGFLDSSLRGPDVGLAEGTRGPLVAGESSFALPSRDLRIVSRDSVNGKPVEEALRFLVVVAYSAGAFFLDRPILLTLERAGRLDLKIQQSLTDLQRIADPDVIREQFAAALQL